MSTNTEASTSTGGLDWLKWLVVVGLVGGGIFANWYYQDQSLLIRVAALIVVARPPGDTPKAYLKGAPEVLLAMCDRILKSGEAVPLCEQERERVIAVYRKLAGRGERGLALAWRPADSGELPEDGYIFIGLTGMIDPPRPEVPEALSKCRSAGIRVAMLTGDYGLTAQTIARQIGMITGPGRVVQGDELAAIDADELSQILQHEEELVFAFCAQVQFL